MALGYSKRPNTGWGAPPGVQDSEKTQSICVTLRQRITNHLQSMVSVNANLNAPAPAQHRPNIRNFRDEFYGQPLQALIKTSRVNYAVD